MISYNNSAPTSVNNVGQFGATEGSIGAYKQAAEYAADAKYWALLSQTKYSTVDEILAEVEHLYSQGKLLEEDIKQLQIDFEAQQQDLLGLIQSTNTAIDNTNAATTLSKEATQAVLEQLDIISNMTVQTTLLSPGSMATGSYDNSTGVFSFGIPEGQPGRDGTNGTISDIGDVAIGVPVSDDYGFYVDKDNGGLYRANMSDIANIVPSIRSISINGGEEQTGAVSFNSVSSFNNRTGDVVAQTGDYEVSQITGAAKSGANSDITSLSGLTTALSVSQGGTGATTPEASRTNLGLGSVSVEDIVPLVKGGTGATTPSAARTNLGLGLVSTESIVPITKGGTGSTSAENARLALVAAKSGANSDITSMTNSVTFTQPVSVADAVVGANAVNLGQISSDHGASLIGTVEGESVQTVINNIDSELVRLRLIQAMEKGYSDSGFTFASGGTLTVDSVSKLVLWPSDSGGDGLYYVWRGSLPKDIPAGSSPETTGGISESAWGEPFDQKAVNIPAQVGYNGGEVYPATYNDSLSIGITIPVGTRFVRVNGSVLMFQTALTSPLVVSSFDSTSINGTTELYPLAFYNEVNSGWKIAQNDSQLARLLPLAGNIGIAYTPVTVEGIFTIQGDIRLKPLLPKVTVDSRQFWLRSPRTWNEANQEFDYTPYDIRIVGNFLFDFYRQNASFDPGVGLAMQSAGTLELSGCESQGAWNSNVTMDYGRWVLADNLYSHDCGRGQIQQPDGSNRTGMAIMVNDPTEAHVHHIRCANTWASSLFFSSRTPGRTKSLMVHDVSIDTSGGNGLRIQSNDLVNGLGGGTAITKVNVSAVTIKNCESHGFRGNFRNGVVTGLYIEGSNAGISIEGASDVSYDNVVISNCSQGLLCRFYPVENTRMRFSNFLISGCSAGAVYFLRNSANTTTNLADIEFDGITIHALANGAKGFTFNGGSASETTTDLTLKNVRIVGVYPITEGGHYSVIVNCRNVEVDGMNLRGCNGSAESYLQVQATNSVIVNRLVAVQPFGTVNRPIYTNGSGSDAIVNITNCVAPDTTSGSIGYSAPVPIKRYEANNQFANSATPQQFAFTNSATLRGGDASTLTTPQLANIVATLINDISLGRFVIR